MKHAQSEGRAWPVHRCQVARLEGGAYVSSCWVTPLAVAAASGRAHMEQHDVEHDPAAPHIRFCPCPHSPAGEPGAVQQMHTAFRAQQAP